MRVEKSDIKKRSFEDIGLGWVFRCSSGKLNMKIDGGAVVLVDGMVWTPSQMSEFEVVEGVFLEGYGS